MEKCQRKRKKFIETNLQYYHFQQDGWKNRFFFRENKLNMNWGEISGKFRLLRKSTTILNDVK